jgi:hypothetical protein
MSLTPALTDASVVTLAALTAVYAAANETAKRCFLTTE